MTSKLFFSVVLMVLIVAPASALTVSATDLKWQGTNVRETTSKTVYITENTGEALAVFSSSVAAQCRAEPPSLKGNGIITLTCNAPAGSLVGYARIGEKPASGSMVSTGVRIPIALSSTSTPAVEPTPAPTKATAGPTAQPTEAFKRTMTSRPVQPTTAASITITAPPATQQSQPEQGFSLSLIAGVMAAGAALVAAFLIVLFYDDRRGRR